MTPSASKWNIALVLLLFFKQLLPVGAVPTAGSSGILFPDDKRIFKSPTPIRPKCIETAENFCTDVKNYPEQLLQSILLAESNKYEQLFGDDLLPNEDDYIDQRFDDSEELSLCSSRDRVIYPQAGITKDNHWSIIVNQKNFTQGIRVEECLNAGMPCSHVESFPNGLRTQCKQKYIYRQLLSLNPSGYVVKDWFWLPCCCMCSYSVDFG